MVAFLVLNVVLMGGTEEIDSRGVLQPILEERFSVSTTGSLIGGIWLVWHPPLFWTDNPNFVLELSEFGPYVVFIIGVSLVLGALINVTDGAVVPAIVLHSTVNLGAFLGVSGGWLNNQLASLVIGAGVWWSIEVIFLVRYGLDMTPEGRKTVTPPRVGGQSTARS